MMIAYKIVKYSDVDGHYETLFHGIDGSKTIPERRWLKASVKPVRDGSGGTLYDSGIHVLPSLSDALKYMENFKNPWDKCIVKVQVRGEMREKEHSRSPVVLADEVKILEEVVVLGGESWD